jgi:hypothetical protein
MTRGAYGNVNHGQGLNGHVPRKRRNSQASGLKLRAPYLYPDHYKRRVIEVVPVVCAKIPLR